jgi:hypothetical protein
MFRLRLPAASDSRPPGGQALVEFALILPLLVLLLVMAIDFGRVFFGWVSINNAARVGAAYAAANADAWEGAGDTVRQSRYETLVANDLQAINCAVGSIPAPAFDDLDADGTADTGELLEVALACDFTLVTPFATAILGTVELGGAATFPVHHTLITELPSPPPPPPPPTCTVPNTVSGTRNQARQLWDDASFQPANLIESGTGNFTVGSQSVPAGTQHPCTGSMTITAASAPGPTPTPAPTCARPSADFSATPTTGRSPVTVQFTDLSVTTPQCPILAWQWNFDGAGTSSIQNPSAQFSHTASGQRTRYRISLTVTTAGGSDTETKNNYIEATR